VTVPDRGPVPVPLALRADNVVDLVLQHFGQDTEPDADAEREQALPRCPDQLAQRFLHALGQHGLLHGRLGDRYGLTHGGSSFGLSRSTRHAPTRSGRAGGTAVTSNFYTRRDNLCASGRRSIGCLQASTPVTFS
jgi:hypothetical protein